MTLSLCRTRSLASGSRSRVEGSHNFPLRNAILVANSVIKSGKPISLDFPQD